MTRFANRLFGLGALALILGNLSLLAAKPKGELKEVVIKGNIKEEPSVEKPFLDIPVDSYEAIRPSLEPDRSLLLAESPSIAAWSGDSRIMLRTGHLLQPWNDILLGKVETLRLR